MERIITISREFGSGGRELGKRLADELGFAYYDREIVTAIAEKTKTDEDLVEHTLETGPRTMVPLTFGHTFDYIPEFPSESKRILGDQYDVIMSMAEHGDAVFIGRHADVILESYKPLKIFVYAELLAKIERCRERAPEDEHLSDRELARKIRQVDKGRSASHVTVSDLAWGDKVGYDLMVNTTEMDLKVLAKALAEYARHFFESQGQ